MSATIGTWLFALGLVLSWANSAAHIVLSDRPLYMHSRRALQGGVRGARIAVLAIPTVVYLVLVAAFVVGVWPEWIAAGLLISMLAIRRVEIQQWPGDIVVRLGKYVPAAACLLGWLVAQPLLRALGFTVDQARVLGWDAACGVMAGAYVLAGIAKLRESGAIWAHPRHHALLIAERAYSGPRWVRRVRLAVARSRSASLVVGVSGLVMEFAAIAFVVPAARPALVAAVYVLHLGFVILLGYFEPEWLVVIAAVALLGS